jgi:hypothetical protein
MNYVCLASQDKQSGALARKSQQLPCICTQESSAHKNRSCNKVRHAKAELLVPEITKINLSQNQLRTKF